MNYIKYIILGIIQGLTEPLPISSSGHIFLFKNIFETNLFNSLDFEIISNFGSFLAILFIFRKDIFILLKHFFLYIIKKEKQYINNYLYCIKIIISSIPVGIIGLLFNDYFEKNFLSLKILGFSFLVTALLLYSVKSKNGNKNSFEITIKDAIIIGLFQIITIIPGISRSGTVLVATLLCKIKKEDALKYTFMLYFPVSIGTLLLKIPTIVNTNNIMFISYLIGMITSLIITYVSYKWLTNIVKNGKLYKFSIYCLFVSLFIFIYFR